MPNNTFVIIQARMGSSRLPGKVLMDVGGLALLEALVTRLELNKGEHKFVVATTDSNKDDALAQWCSEKNYPFFRGGENDVLGRFYNAAIEAGAKSGDTIVRICADNPLHHVEVLEFALEKFTSRDLDYFSNSNWEPDVLEDGFDTEVFSFDLLEIAQKEASKPSDREHVCPFMKQPDRFKCGWEKYRKDYMEKLSVDTVNDMALCRAIFKEFAPRLNFTMDDILALLKRKPELLELNADSEINAGYKKSLREDGET